MKKSIKKTLNHQEVKAEINALHKNKIEKLFLIERVGYLLILLSGLLPFLHSFVKFEKLENKIFGFTSIQSFLYSFGVHLSILCLTLGVLLSISAIADHQKYRAVQVHLRYALISPFISAIFYCSWVFIPNVNYDLLAYVFLSIFICAISLLIFKRISSYIESMKRLSRYRETVLNNGLSYLKSKLTNN